MDNVKHVGRLLFEYAVSEAGFTQAEGLDDLSDLGQRLKHGESDFERALGKKIEDDISEYLQEHNRVCPECFEESLECRQVYSGDYYNPPEYVTCCTSCGWHD